MTLNLILTLIDILCIIALLWRSNKQLCYFWSIIQFDHRYRMRLVIVIATKRQIDIRDIQPISPQTDLGRLIK